MLDRLRAAGDTRQYSGPLRQFASGGFGSVSEFQDPAKKGTQHREIKILTALSLGGVPGITKIVATTTIQNCPAMVMEDAGTCTMREVRQQLSSNPLKTKIICDAMAQVLCTLIAVHNTGYSHLDVKADNIMCHPVMVEDRGTRTVTRLKCTLIDFGSGQTEKEFKGLRTLPGQQLDPLIVRRLLWYFRPANMFAGAGSSAGQGGGGSTNSPSDRGGGGSDDFEQKQRSRKKAVGWNLNHEAGSSVGKDHDCGANDKGSDNGNGKGTGDINIDDGNVQGGGGAENVSGDDDGGDGGGGDKPEAGAGAGSISAEPGDKVASAKRKGKGEANEGQGSIAKRTCGDSQRSPLSLVGEGDDGGSGSGAGSGGGTPWVPDRSRQQQQQQQQKEKEKEEHRQRQQTLHQSYLRSQERLRQHGQRAKRVGRDVKAAAAQATGVRSSFGSIGRYNDSDSDVDLDRYQFRGSVPQPHRSPDTARPVSRAAAAGEGSTASLGAQDTPYGGGGRPQAEQPAIAQAAQRVGGAGADGEGTVHGSGGGGGGSSSVVGQQTLSPAPISMTPQAQGAQTARGTGPQPGASSMAPAAAAAAVDTPAIKQPPSWADGAADVGRSSSPMEQQAKKQLTRGAAGEIFRLLLHG
eukprot:g15226.t1